MAVPARARSQHLELRLIFTNASRLCSRVVPDWCWLRVQRAPEKQPRFMRRCQRAVFRASRLSRLKIRSNIVLRASRNFRSTSKAGFGFANALRAILRHDPDVILVGEMRDTETAEVAVQAALTGHLVLSTLHTTDAASAITRLTEMGIAPYLVAATGSGCAGATTAAHPV